MTTYEFVTADPACLGAMVRTMTPSSVVVVTDENVARLQGESLEASLAAMGSRVTRVVLRPGESNKTLTAVGRIWDAALGAGVDRDAVVVAFGGGVVGDLAGFAASTLLRGLRVVQVPTTLLAMADASTGAKTGFDHPLGKNLIGTFHSPCAVVVDVAHLDTLPRRERIAGLAEIVKIGLVADAGLLDAIERDARALREGDVAALGRVVRRAIDDKLAIVGDDPLEAGRRTLLNVGHTIGHALEAHGAFARYRHGEAVAIGTLIELHATAALGWTDHGLVSRVRSVLESLGLPTAVARAELEGAWHYVGRDKKRRGSTLRFPVVAAPGDGLVVSLSADVLRDAALTRSESWSQVA